jgi:hypothetical protein
MKEIDLSIYNTNPISIEIHETSRITYSNNGTLYKYLIDNNNDILLFFQFIGFTFRQYPGQSRLFFILLELWVLASAILSSIGYVSCMRKVYVVFILNKDGLVPMWFLIITVLLLAVTINTQIVSIGLSVYKSRIHLSKENHSTTETVMRSCFHKTLRFFFSMQTFAIASLILFCTKGNNFAPYLNYTYINFSIGIMNIVLTSWLTVVLFFLILSTSQIQAVQKMMVAEAQSQKLTIERYIVLKNDINTHIYT